jgi:hypothetical protein
MKPHRDNMDRYTRAKPVDSSWMKYTFTDRLRISRKPTENEIKIKEQLNRFDNYQPSTILSY